MFKRYSKLLLIAIMLVTCEILIAAPIVRAANPTIFIKPSTVIGDLTPTPGSVTQWNVNVSDIGPPGLITFEFYIALDPVAFPEYYPTAGNSNFTANVNGWTTTTSGTVTGTPTFGWDAADGNPSGSGPGSLYLRATSTASAIASITFYSEYSFTWPGISPLDGAARISFAYKISGTSIGSPNTLHIMTVKPTGSTGSILSKNYATAQPWSYNFTLCPASAFNQAGNYKLRLRTVLKAAAVGTGNYVQVNWDDVGLRLAKVGAKEGPFLKSDPHNTAATTAFTAKYLQFPTNSSIYVLSSLVGTIWEDWWPVQGGGTIAYVNATADYGVGYLNLWGTKLLEPGLMGDPVEITHDSTDAYFDNRIPGDIAGPESPPASGLYPYDRNVNNYDLAYIRMKFGTNDPQADFTGPENPPGSGTYPPDGIVDVRDLRPIGKNYGRHYP